MLIIFSSFHLLSLEAFHSPYEHMKDLVESTYDPSRLSARLEPSNGKLEDKHSYETSLNNYNALTFHLGQGVLSYLADNNHGFMVSNNGYKGGGGQGTWHSFGENHVLYAQDVFVTFASL